MNTQLTSTQFIQKLFNGLCVIMIAFLAMTSITHAAGSTHGIAVMASADVESSNCKYVGDVWGTSSWGKSSLTVWKNKAEHRAMKMAKDLDATHVAWEGQTEGGYGNDPHAYGKAYRCEGSGRAGDVASVGNKTTPSATN